MRILRFTFVLCLLAAISYGQKEPQKKIKPKRTDNYIRMKGIRFGADITRPFQDLWTKGNRYGTEFSADMELWPNLFPVFESGFDVMKINTSYIDYKSSGSYSRIGMDYNFLQAENKNDKNIFYVGLRYGFVLARQQVNSYTIDSYWTPTTGRFSNQNYFAHWGEFLVGIKGEIVHNFYMGWTIRGKIKLNNKDLGMPPTYFIPGYGKAEKGFNLDFTYSVYYNLPWDFRKSIDRKKDAIGVPAKGTVTKKTATQKTPIKK
jgi:hypothetical protein